jgi:hypothetical protein
MTVVHLLLLLALHQAPVGVGLASKRPGVDALAPGLLKELTQDAWGGAAGLLLGELLLQSGEARLQLRVGVRARGPRGRGPSPSCLEGAAGCLRT